MASILCCLSFTSVLGDILPNTTIKATAATNNSSKRLRLSENTSGPRYHIDGNGNIVHLFGMARCQSHAFEEEEDRGGTVRNQIKGYANYGANYTRLAINAFDLFGKTIDDSITAKTDAEIDAWIAKKVDPDVQAILAEGMYVGLDIHVVDLGSVDCSSGKTADKVLSFVKKNFTPLAKRLANYYKNEPMIANIELWNEPCIGGITTSANGLTWADALREYYIYTINEVRKIDPTRILMVSDNNAGWGYNIDDFWRGHYDKLGDNVVFSAHVSHNEFDKNGTYEHYANWALNVANTRNICIFFNEVENEPGTSTNKSIENFCKFMDENKSKYHLSACLWRPHLDYIEKPQIWATNGWTAKYTGGTLKLDPSVTWFRTNGGSSSASWGGDSVTFGGNNNAISSSGASTSYTREFVKIKNFTGNILFTKNKYLTSSDANRIATDLTGYEYVVVKMKFFDKSVAETALAANSSSPFITLDDGTSVSFANYKSALLENSGKAKIGEWVTLVLPLSKKLSGCYHVVSMNLGYTGKETHFYTIDFVTSDYAAKLKNPDVDLYANKKLDLYGGPDYTMKGMAYYPNLSIGVSERFLVRSDYTTIRMKLRLPDYNTLRKQFTNGGRYAVGGGSFTYGDESDLAIYFLGDGATHVGVTKIRFREILKNYETDLKAGKTVTVDFPISGTFVDGGVIESMHFMLAHDSRASYFDGKPISVSDVEFLTDTMFLDNSDKYEFVGNKTEPQLKITPAYGVHTSKGYHSIKFDIKLPQFAELVNYMTAGSDLSVGGGSFSYDKEKDFALYFTGNDIGTVGVTQKDFFDFFNRYEEELSAGKTLTVTLPLTGTFKDHGFINGMNLMFSNGDSALKFDKQLIYLSNIEFISSKEFYLEGGPEFTMSSGWYTPQLETGAKTISVNSSHRKLRFDIALEDAKTLINNMSTGSGSTVGGGSWSYYEGDLAFYFTGQNVDGVGIMQGDFFEFLRNKQNLADLNSGKTLTATLNIGGSFPDNAVITGMKMFVAHPSNGTGTKDHSVFEGKKIYLSNMAFIEECGGIEEKFLKTDLDLKNGPDYKFSGNLWEPQLIVQTESFTTFNELKKIKFDLKMPEIEKLRPNMSLGSKGGGATYDKISYDFADFAIYFGGANVNRVGVTQGQFFDAIDENKAALAKGETVTLEFDLSGEFRDYGEITSVKIMIAHDSKAAAFDGSPISISNVEFPYCQEFIPIELQNGPSYSMANGSATKPNLSVSAIKGYTVSENYSKIRFKLKMPEVNEVISKFEWGSVGGNVNSDSISYTSSDFALYFTGVRRVGVTQEAFKAALVANKSALSAGKTVTVELPLSGRFLADSKISGINFMFNNKSTGLEEKEITVSDIRLVCNNFETEITLKNGSSHKLSSNDGWHPQLTAALTSPVQVGTDLIQITFGLKLPDIETLRPLMSNGSKGGNIYSTSPSYDKQDFAIYFSGANFVGVTQEDFYKALDENLEALANGETVDLKFNLTGNFKAGSSITAVNLMVAHHADRTPVSVLEAAFNNAEIAIEDIKFISRLGHDEINHNSKEATCVEKGWDAYVTCSRCDYNTQISEYGEHNIVTVNAVAPTCTKSGLTEGEKCSLCSYVKTKQKKVAAKGHTLTKAEAKAPTCTTSGWNAYDYCSECDYTTKVEIPATGHSYNKEVTAPTCEDKGYTTYTCHCGDSYVADYVDAKGHAYEVTAHKDATCTEDGYDVYTCKNDKTHTYTTVLNKLGHTLVKVDAKAPTCTEAGYEAYEYCSVCDYTTFKEVPATGHTYDAVVTDPTCEDKGYTTYTCHCGESYVADYVEAKGHSYTAKVTAPTCTEEGYTIFDCVNCGDNYKSNIVSARGHNEVIDEAIEPTYTSAGLTEGSHCDTCGEIIKAQEIIPAKEYILGDADESSVIDILDLVMLKDAILNNQYSILVDMNKDGILNSLDIITLKKLIWEVF